jgi:hypothetical protein
VATAGEVLQIWLFLTGAYPGWGGDDVDTLKATCAVYEIMLADLPFPVLQEAAVRHVAISRFFPTVAELREQALRCGADVLDPAEAWQVVRDRMLSGTTTPTRTPDFGDSLIQRTVEALGWRDLCLSEGGTYDRGLFIKTYERLRDRQREEQTLPKIVSEMRQRRLSPGGAFLLPKSKNGGGDHGRQD